MARERPDWAITASRFACVLLKIASVATTTSVVLWLAEPLVTGLSACSEKLVGQPSPPNSPARSTGAAQNHGPSPIVTLPTAFTAASAPTTWPSVVTAEAEPSPPLQLTVVAPVPAPTLPSAKSAFAAAAAAAA